MFYLRIFVYRSVTKVSSYVFFLNLHCFTFYIKICNPSTTDSGVWCEVELKICLVFICTCNWPSSPLPMYSFVIKSKHVCVGLYQTLFYCIGLFVVSLCYWMWHLFIYSVYLWLIQFSVPVCVVTYTHQHNC